MAAPAVSLDPKALSVALIEHDVNGDDLCVWSYPSVSATLQAVCVQRCGSEGQQTPFIYFKLKNEWIYALTMPTLKDVLPDVENASVCIICRSFNPEKYYALSQILFEQYSGTGDPTKLLEGFLSVHTTGNFSNLAGTFDMTSYKDTDAYTRISMLSELNTMLGVEMVLLWNAVLLKKRILIISSEDSGKLFSVVRSLPQLVWHRQDWSMLRPLVRAEEPHLEDLQTCGVFIAGTLDTALGAKSELYDVVLSLDERRVNVTKHAQLEMKMCSVHREMAALLADASEKNYNDSQIIKIISTKTVEVLTQLRGLAPSGDKLTEDLVNNSVTNPIAQQWLIRFAVSEGLL